MSHVPASPGPCAPPDRRDPDLPAPDRGLHPPPFRLTTLFALFSRLPPSANEIAMAKTRDDLFRHLADLAIETSTITHPPLFTVEESKCLRGEIPGGHTKNLFLKDKKGRLFLVVAIESADINLKRLHTRIGASGRLSFGNAELMQEKLGVIPGSVTPFGLINDVGQDVTVILDAAMMEHDILNYHPLENTATTTIAAKDLLAFIRSCGHEPQILPVSNQDDAE